MNLKYIIAMDFEATQPGPMEIIEFPAVLINLTTGAQLSQFHEYVKPTINPILTYACSNFTGIYQNDVDKADELLDVLHSFDLWLRRVNHLYNLVLPTDNLTTNCAFVTWGDYDFKHMLIPECKYKNYPIPKYFTKWIDLRTTFRLEYSCGNIGFKKALEIANIPVEGRLHSGISDAKNLASLALHLYRHNGNFSQLSIIA